VSEYLVLDKRLISGQDHTLYLYNMAWCRDIYS